MSKKIKIDSSLNLGDYAFGVRIDNNDVFIPENLAKVIEHIPLGDNPATVADFIRSFPTAVANYLGFSPEKVLKSADDFIKLLGK